MEFANSGYLLLLLLLIPYLLWYFLRGKGKEPTMRMSDTFAYQHTPKSWKVKMIHLPMALRCIVYALVVIVLARPQTYNTWDNKDTEGIDIMLTMDISASMLTEDVFPNRNVGSISPMTAATIAKKFGIRVYTIGLGRETGEDIGAIDYKTLQDIAVLTNGEFYRAQSQAELSKIYQDIDKLEKTKMNIKSYDHLHEAYMPFAWLALLLFCFELILRWTVFRRLP